MSAFVGFDGRIYRDGEAAGLSAVFGMQNMGKTTEVVRLANQCRGTCVLWDYAGTHGGLVRGAVDLYQPGQLKQVLRARVPGKRLAIRYVPRDRTFIDHFRAMCEICTIVRDMVIIADEVDACCGSKWGDTRMPPELYEIAHMGRHHHLAMIITARDTVSVSKSYRSQCHSLRVFRVTEGDELDYIAKRIGTKNAALLPSLPEFHYLHWISGDPVVRIMTGGKVVRTI